MSGTEEWKVHCLPPCPVWAVMLLSASHPRYLSLRNSVEHHRQLTHSKEIFIGNKDDKQASLVDFQEDRTCCAFFYRLIAVGTDPVYTGRRGSACLYWQKREHLTVHFHSKMSSVCCLNVWADYIYTFTA